MATSWTVLRVPTSLKERLDAEAVRLQNSRDALPDHVPPWVVIQRALDHVDAKRRRSNRRKPAVSVYRDAEGGMEIVEPGRAGEPSRRTYCAAPKPPGASRL